MDTLTKEQRHYNMSRIRGTDTKPEILARKYLFSRGLRYRKNEKRLPGRPDIVLPRFRTVVFVNGCFWHGHEGCGGYRLPKSNIDYWRNKIEGNIERDRRERKALLDSGWCVIVVWECALQKKRREATLEILYMKIMEAGRRVQGKRHRSGGLVNGTEAVVFTSNGAESASQGVFFEIPEYSYARAAFEAEAAEICGLAADVDVEYKLRSSEAESAETFEIAADDGARYKA